MAFVQNGELSIKAATSMPFPAVSNERPRYVNMGSPEEWKAYRAEKGNAGLGWARMFKLLGILVNTDRGPTPYLEQTKQTEVCFPASYGSYVQHAH